MVDINDAQHSHHPRTLKITPPTLSLPPLTHLLAYSTDEIKSALRNLHELYFSSSSCPKGKNDKPKHDMHDASAPDSGYASAEEDEEEGSCESDGGIDVELELLRSDALQRSFAIRWVTGFVARSDAWIDACGALAAQDERNLILDQAVTLLAAFNNPPHDREEDKDLYLTRKFTFHSASEEIHVELFDAPPWKDDDHTAVGLQSWGSCILFAERMCSDADVLQLERRALAGERQVGLRVLELGAGTGMLSIVAAKLIQAHGMKADIVATDFHPAVLKNLSVNVRTNSSRCITIAHLDWENPSYDAHDGAFEKPFDVVLAADVVYHPDHARWVKQVVERVLARPQRELDLPGGVFWLFIPVRTTGRHEGMAETLEVLFPCASVGMGDELVILQREEIARQDGVGRADEGGYKLFKIGWL
jgi:SAM-dependent methyltransferase